MKRILALIFLLPSLAVAQESQNRIIQATPTVSITPAYASNDVVGSLLTFNAACNFRTNKGEILGVKIFDKAAQAANMDLVLFSTTPTGTFTDNGAFTPADATLPNIVAVIPITNHSSFADNSVSYASNILVPASCNSSGQLFGYLVSRATPTYATTSDVTVQIELAPNM